MKTQLMHDIGESSGLPLPPPRPAVRRPPAPAGPPPAPDAPDASDASAAQDVPPPAAPPAAPPEPATAMPDWLVERLRDDAAEADAARRRGVRKRRAVGWGLAAAVLAALAAGGLWMAEENRVDGTLRVVADVTPAPPAPTPAPVVPLPPPDDPAAVVPADRAPTAKDAAPAIAPAPRPQRRPAAARRASTPRRREETLMQCRAHGYDARQCDVRACTMTRYGFACRG